MSDPVVDSGHKTFQTQKMTEVLFDLGALMQEVAIERASSSLAKQIIDQNEIARTVQEHFKKKNRGNSLPKQ